MPLKTKKVEYIEVSYKDLERLIREVYQQPKYEIVADEEWNNDSDYTFSVERKELDQWQAKDIDGLKTNGTAQYGLPSILADLCNNGHIEPGEYLISVCW